MELESLKNSWRACDACTGHTEADWERMTAQIAAGKMQSSKQRLLLRWRIACIIMVLLPLQMLPLFQGGSATTRCAGWLLLGGFIAAGLLRFVRLRELLRGIDPATRTLRETCAAIVELRRTFLHGVVVNATLALLLLGTLALHQGQMNRPEVLYGFGIGLCVGLPFGICIFRRISQDIEMLSSALRNVDES